MPDRREETIQRKDILEKLDKLSLKVAEGFARNEVVGGNIVNRLDTLNGKVAEHERILTDFKIREAVQKQTLDGLQKIEDGREQDGKKYRFMTVDKAVSFAIGLISMGLVALITFYLTYKR